MFLGASSSSAPHSSLAAFQRIGQGLHGRARPENRPPLRARATRSGVAPVQREHVLCSGHELGALSCNIESVISPRSHHAQGFVQVGAFTVQAGVVGTVSIMRVRHEDSLPHGCSRVGQAERPVSVVVVHPSTDLDAVPVFVFHLDEAAGLVRWWAVEDDVDELAARLVSSDSVSPNEGVPQ